MSVLVIIADSSIVTISYGEVVIVALSVERRRIAGLPFAEAGTVVAEQKRIAEFTDIRFSRKHRGFLVRLTECSHPGFPIFLPGTDPDCTAEHIVEQNLVIRKDRIAARHIRLVHIFGFVARDQCQTIPKERFRSTFRFRRRYLTFVSCKFHTVSLYKTS